MSLGFKRLNCSVACTQRHINWLVCYWGIDKNCCCEILNKAADNQNSLAGGTVEGSLQPVHTKCPRDSILIHLNPHRTIHFNIILPIWHIFTSSAWSRLFRFSDKNFASVTSLCGLNLRNFEIILLDLITPTNVYICSWSRTCIPCKHSHSALQRSSWWHCIGNYSLF